jgi:hypothetical protein
VAAVLTGSDITAKGDGQAAGVDAFLSATISGSKKLLQ